MVCRSSPLVVEDYLVEVVVLPFPGDFQVPWRHPDLPEACLYQHPLRSGIVHQAACLEARRLCKMLCARADATARPRARSSIATE